MENLKAKVYWPSERPDERDDNEGKHFGIYIFDCLAKDYDPEEGLGSYDIVEAFWFETEKQRDAEYAKL